MLGFSLKAGVFPLHTWVPDVYGYAPSSISGLLAGVTSKSMLFILPVICLRLGVTKVELGSYLLVFACFNMVIGSIRMLGQSRLRRFLAYSAITQTGFLMFSLGIGFYFDLDQAVSASLYLFLGIAVMKSLAFLASGVYQFYLRTQDIEELRGEGLRFPQIAISFSIALAGLAGIPLLAGFTGKWLVFSAALRVRHIFSTTSLVVFLICSIIGFGGYLPVLVKQYFRSSDKQNQINEHKRTEKISFWMLTPIVFLSVLVIIIGAYPSPWIQLIDYVIQWMLI
jgi:multicomponent Na+:H+ antiporter subunit D